MNTNPTFPAWRQRLHTIVFESDTRAGRAFDVVLLFVILASVAAVMLDSVAEIHAKYGLWLYRAELAFTALFTIEYILRLIAVARPLAYARSFFGLIDLLAILPGYLSLLTPGTEYLLIIRLLRMLRIFRVLKLVAFFNESQIIIAALRASRTKIMVFMFAVVQQHPRFCLLGHRHHHHRGLWRYCATDAPRPVCCIMRHDTRLRNHCRAHRHRHCTNRAGQPHCDSRSNLSFLRRGGTRPRRQVLQVLWHLTVIATQLHHDAL
jgi:hypothetical protein